MLSEYQDTSAYIALLKELANYYFFWEAYNRVYYDYFLQLN